MLFLFGLIGLWRFGTTNYLWFAGLGLAGMVLTKETYIFHIVCALLAVPATWLSHKITAIPEAKPVRQRWTSIDLVVVIAASVALIVFFYSGTFLTGEVLKAFIKHSRHGFRRVKMGTATKNHPTIG